MNIPWLAGFFDGEGCITFRYGHYPQLVIVQNNFEILDEIRNIYGGNIYNYVAEQYRWQISSRPDLKHFLEDVLPYLRIKNEVAERALEYASMIPEGKGGRPRVCKST